MCQRSARWGQSRANHESKVGLTPVKLEPGPTGSIICDGHVVPRALQYGMPYQSRSASLATESTLTYRQSFSLFDV